MEKRQKTSLESGALILIVAAILVAVNALSALGIFARKDVTETEKFTLSKGSGHADNAMASTTSMILTIPMIRLISTSFDRTGPSRNAAARLARTPRLRSIASNGATDSDQLAAAHRVNNPSVATIARAK